ncbi:hypothetical protein Acr_05g0004020 [Actinidia rufa]|uniref:Glycine-rich protein n=1 Tax=Actinidia rufa TaxID=165716 RepID=A0A7J0EJW8_9ERIC|nr:hypothetical protein Acr_05g0004020 [Actinidia rufa]
MKPTFTRMNGTHNTNNNSFWKWKGITMKNKKNQERWLSVPEFLQENSRKREEEVLGPGGGGGVGCGVGVGVGLVGGVGYGGSPWNHLKMVFGFGMGCGVGLGIGYGQGFGLGFSLDALKSHLSKQNSDNSRQIVIQIPDIVPKLGD